MRLAVAKWLYSVGDETEWAGEASPACVKRNPSALEPKCNEIQVVWRLGLPQTLLWKRNASWSDNYLESDGFPPGVSDSSEDCASSVFSLHNSPPGE